MNAQDRVTNSSRAAKSMALVLHYEFSRYQDLLEMAACEKCGQTHWQPGPVDHGHESVADVLYRGLLFYARGPLSVEAFEREEGR